MIKSTYKKILFVLGIVLFSITLNGAEPRLKGNPVFDSKLPQDYTWFVVSSTKSVSRLLSGNLRKNLQVYTQDQGKVNIVIENYENGSVAFVITFKDITLDKVTITFNKETKEAFIKGTDPRKAYKDPLKFYSYNDTLYFGLLKSAFNAL